MNRRAFALGATMILLCSIAAVALRSFAEATFLAAYGRAQMPWLLIATAAGFAVATLGYDALTARAHARIVDLSLLGTLGVLAGASPALLRAGISPAVLVVALTAASQVAGLALWNRVAATVAGRDARRMLPRAGAAVTAGGAIAGLGAAPVIPWLGIDVLPYAAAAVTAIVIGVCIVQDRALTDDGAAGGAGPTVASPPQALGVLQRRLLAALIATAVLEGVVTTVIDLQFVATVKARYSGDTVAVALALFYGGTNAVLLVLQLAAVPRLLVTRSLTFTTAIHPALVIASYAGFALAPGFIAIAGTRTADQVLRLATSRTSQELALSALPPLPRARWKVLLRGLVWPAGAAASAYVLLLIGPHVLREPAYVALAAIGVAIAWAIAARLAARRFQAALGAPLGIRETRVDDPRRIDLETLERWTHAAGDADPKQAALARATLARVRVAPADLADHLRHDEPAVRAALFDQLARSPAPELRGELRAALAIEDDDRALALGIEALAIAGDDEALTRAAARTGLSRDVDDAARSAAAMLRGTDVLGELGRLLARDPAWAVALIAARRAELPDAVLVETLGTAIAQPATRAGALVAIVRAGPMATLPLVADALAAGDPAAVAALADLDADGAARLASELAAAPAWSPNARMALARALAGAPAAGSLVAVLVADPDPEVAYAALRTALAIARGGGLPSAPIAAAHDAALAALVAYLDAREVVEGTCARAELAIATRRCVARLLWAAAVAAAGAGRDPAPIAATARHLIGGGDADRKRALDVAQELAMPAEILAALERWLGRAAAATGADLARHDPWLASLARGELAELEPALIALRRPALFGSVAGPALAALAARSTMRRIDGTLFAAGEAGDAMFVVAAGALVARRAGAPDRRLETGSVVGELAVLTSAPRAADVAADGTADVIAIDREAFAAAARRAPELVLGLSATLAGWLAPDRPDVL